MRTLQRPSISKAIRRYRNRVKKSGNGKTLGSHILNAYKREP